MIAMLFHACGEKHKGTPLDALAMIHSKKIQPENNLQSNYESAKTNQNPEKRFQKSDDTVTILHYRVMLTKHIR
jgi:hypothetical protein